MLTFLRKIRRSIIESNSVRKPASPAGRYLLYAIGEIALVVIGILIALQINNWNEWRKNRNHEQQYLLRILSDLEKDTLFLGNKISLSLMQQNSYKRYIEELYNTQQSKEEFISLTSSVNWEAENLILQDNAYKELMNTGNLSLIENEELKDMIINYYREFEVARSRISEMNQTGINMFSSMTPYLIKYFSISSHIFDNEIMYEGDNLTFLNDPASNQFKYLEGVAGYYSLKQLNFLDYYSQLRDLATELIEYIKVDIID